MDSEADYFPERLNHSIDPDFPKVFTWDSTCPSPTIGRVTRELVDAELHRCGALVLRGLPLRRRSAPPAAPSLENAYQASFSEFLHSTGYRLTKYVGGVTLRPEAEPMIYPASEEDCRVCMDLHQDNTYWPHPPRKLFFYYEEPAKVGGLNPLLDMRSFMTRIPASVVHKLEQLGVRYDSFYPDAAVDDRFVSWQRAFGTLDRLEVESLLRSQASDGVGFEWSPTGGLRKWTVCSPFKQHPVTGEKVWVNMIQANHASYFHDHPTFPELSGIAYSDEDQALTLLKQRIANFEFYPFHILYGDGSPVEYKEVIQILRGLAWHHARIFQPQAGDVLVIDNYLTQHGRLGYEGPRKLWLGISLS